MPDQSPHCVIAGFGKLGAPLTRLLKQDGFRVTAIARHERPEEDAVLPVDIARPEALQAAADRLAPIDFLVIVLAPGESTEAAYQRIYYQGTRNLLDGLPLLHCQRVVFVSSTSVFSENEGGIITDAHPADCSHGRSRWLVAAEDLLEASALPVTRVRFAGIYGRGGRFLLSRVEAIARERSPWPQAAWTNRIHQQDCLGILQCLLRRCAQGQPVPGTINASDGCPVINHEVYRFVAGHQQWSLPPLPEERVHPVAGKRIVPGRLDELGYTLKVPDWQAGLRDQLR